MALIIRENATCQLLNEQLNLYNNTNSEICSPDFDRSLCWYNVTRGENGHRQCPFTFCPTVPGCQNVAAAYHVTRHCHLNGTWGGSVYSACLDLLKTHSHCIVGYCRTCPDVLRETVINVSLTLSVISVGVLVSALILFSIFDSIQCRRLSIHKNLAVAFVFRFAVLAIWTVANTSNAFRDCAHFNPIPLRNWEWLCKMILWLVIYFQVASVMWMLIEGLYLYSRFTVFGMRRSESPYAIYLVSGWGIPLVVVCAWTFVHESRSRQNRHSFCWLPYAQGAHLWILAGTMGLALILNVLFLLAIVIILMQKLRSENSAESKKIWRTVKATILLVPLLGISNIPLFYEPAKPSAIYMLGSAILQHSQGIFIAVLYCFLNGEIQNAIKRQLLKAPFNWLGFSKAQRYETERTYIPESNLCGTKSHRSHLGTPMDEQRLGRSASADETTVVAPASSPQLDYGRSALDLALSAGYGSVSAGEKDKDPKENLFLMVLDGEAANRHTVTGAENIFSGTLSQGFEKENTNPNDDSLQRIRESVSQFFNENFEKYASRSNKPSAAISALSSINSICSYSEGAPRRGYSGHTGHAGCVMGPLGLLASQERSAAGSLQLGATSFGAGAPENPSGPNGSPGTCHPTIAASELSDSSFSTPTNSTPIRKATTTSLSTSHISAGTKRIRVTTSELKCSTKL